MEAALAAAAVAAALLVLAVALCVSRRRGVMSYGASAPRRPRATAKIVSESRAVRMVRAVSSMFVFRNPAVTAADATHSPEALAAAQAATNAKAAAAAASPPPPE